MIIFTFFISKRNESRFDLNIPNTRFVICHVFLGIKLGMPERRLDDLGDLRDSSGCLLFFISRVAWKKRKKTPMTLL